MSEATSLTFAVPEGQPLAGQTVVFTGRLRLLRRKEGQALVARLGGVTDVEVTARTTMLVVAGDRSARPATASDEAGRAPDQCDISADRRLRRVQAMNRETPGAVRIVTEEEFCRLVGLPSAGTIGQQLYPQGEILTMYPTLRDDHLRDLEKWNLVRSTPSVSSRRCYAFSDLLVLRQVHRELERGASFKGVLRTLLASREGQLAFDFRLNTQPARVVDLGERVKAGREPGSSATLRIPPATTTSEQYFVVASILDDGDPQNQEQAAIGYRKALEQDPGLVPAIVNLANIHYARDELVEAQALYERAAALEANSFEAWFNLGNIHHDLGRYAEAHECYRRALALNSGYAEAHLYLAVTLEKANRSEEAREHWKAYCQLAPDGEWAELAREFSE